MQSEATMSHLDNPSSDSMGNNAASDAAAPALAADPRESAANASNDAEEMDQAVAQHGDDVVAGLREAGLLSDGDASDEEHDATDEEFDDIEADDAASDGSDAEDEDSTQTPEQRAPPPAAVAAAATNAIVAAPAVAVPASIHAGHIASESGSQPSKSAQEPSTGSMKLKKKKQQCDAGAASKRSGASVVKKRGPTQAKLRDRPGKAARTRKATAT